MIFLLNISPKIVNFGDALSYQQTSRHSVVFTAVKATKCLDVCAKGRIYICTDSTELL